MGGLACQEASDFWAVLLGETWKFCYTGGIRHMTRNASLVLLHNRSNLHAQGNLGLHLSNCGQQWDSDYFSYFSFQKWKSCTWN